MSLGYASAHMRSPFFGRYRAVMLVQNAVPPVAIREMVDIQPGQLLLESKGGGGVVVASEPLYGTSAVWTIAIRNMEFILTGVSLMFFLSCGFNRSRAPSLCWRGVLKVAPVGSQ